VWRSEEQLCPPMLWKHCFTLRPLKPLRRPLRAHQASVDTQKRQLYRSRQHRHLRMERALHLHSWTRWKIVMRSAHVWTSALTSEEPRLRPPFVMPLMSLFRRAHIPLSSWTNRTRKTGLNNAMAKQQTSALTQLACLPLPVPLRLLLRAMRHHRCSHLLRVPLARKTRL